MSNSNPPKEQPEFDRYADSYTNLHKASVTASGEEPSYFSAYKAQYMASRARYVGLAPAILDFGCGVGNSVPHLREAFPSAVLHGSDPSGESIRLARLRFEETATFLTSGDNALPYADDSFDLVLVACVLHHILPPERAHWMAELRRVMKPGAQLFVFEHNMLNPLTRKVVRDCPFDEDAVLLPRGELLGLARNAGFGEVGARYVVFFPRQLAPLRPLEPLLSWLPLGAQYVVEAIA